MSFRTVLLVLLALVCAGATVMFARDWAAAQRKVPVATMTAPAAQKPKVHVLVAAEAMPAGFFVRKESLKWQPWPEDGLNDKYVVLKDAAEIAEAGKDKVTAMVGAVSRAAIVPGQPITDALLVHPGDRGFLAAVLTPGSRAISVPVNATTGISGFIFPGDLVDLLLTVRFNNKDEDEGSTEARHATKTILRGVRVLAIDQIVQKTQGEATVVKNVTLEVKPKDSEKVALALEMGSLSLSLRSLALAEDDALLAKAGIKSPEPAAVTLDAEVLATQNLLGGRTAGKGVTVLRGSKESKATF
jgi:pilus assembly protein CpaB